jgi:HEAT repeat protein
MLVGGRGLGGEKDSFELRNGQMVTKPLAGPAEDLLKMLDDLNAADYDQILEMMSELPSQKVETVLAAHGDKLRKLASGKEPEARMAAIVALGKTRSLDNVPALIYSLGKDEDREVVIEARKALERISRNPKGFGPQDDFNDEQRRAAVQKWKAWYLSLRPDAEVDF